MYLKGSRELLHIVSKVTIPSSSNSFRLAFPEFLATFLATSFFLISLPSIKELVKFAIWPNPKINLFAKSQKPKNPRMKAAASGFEAAVAVRINSPKDIKMINN